MKTEQIIKELNEEIEYWDKNGFSAINPDLVRSLMIRMGIEIAVKDEVIGEQFSIANTLWKRITFLETIIESQKEQMARDLEVHIGYMQMNVRLGKEIELLEKEIKNEIN